MLNTNDFNNVIIQKLVPICDSALTKFCVWLQSKELYKGKREENNMVDYGSDQAPDKWNIDNSGNFRLL